MKSHYERGISDVESLLCKAPLTFSVRYLVCVVYTAFISLSLGEYQAWNGRLGIKKRFWYWEQENL